MALKVYNASGELLITPPAHKDSHDPEDGTDKLDAATPVQVGSANAEGSSHSLARADHVHEREHAATTRLNSKVIRESRDMTSATGDVSYTGYGFAPSALICFANLDDFNLGLSWGVCDEDATEFGFCWTPTPNWNSVSRIAYLHEDAGKIQSAVVKTLDADGFTLTWAKDGTPSAGNVFLHFLALR